MDAEIVLRGREKERLMETERNIYSERQTETITTKREITKDIK